MRRLALPLAAALAALVPASASADAAPAGTYACWQTFASYGPNGALSGYNRAARGTVTLREDGRYRVGGERWFLPRGAGRAGGWTSSGDAVRFSSGPYRTPRAGFRLVGALHPEGVPMPHDLREGTTYELVLRSRRGARPSDDAPPRAESPDFFVSFWYCDARVG